MKWLFFALVALNLIVFGGTTLSKIIAAQEADLLARRKEAGAQLARTSSELAEPMVKPKNGGRVEASAASAPSPARQTGDWINDNGGAQEVFVEPADTEEEAAKRIAEREKWAQDEKSRQLARHQEAERRRRAGGGAGYDSYGTDAEAAGGRSGRQCTATAGVTIPEDDYHRIKGLLARWPHAASRTVEQRRDAQKGKTTYAVWTPINIDAGSQMQALQEKGFNTVLMEGGISVGIRADRGQAQALLSRLQGAGFSGQLREINSAGGGGGQSVAKMQVTFMTVSDSDAKAIQNIVGQYGRLTRNRCR
ncbi:Uncharacterised protein [Kingella potus]|uniref:Sporulation related domain n=1 Tax=Kingella potus TaxID=265175 RepID=A0A377QZN0_9NEIS|nr:hypothetical protein [Kingella potus]UOP01033.1 hypothetical protein LVJ84_01240 [Kingella potus]STR00713.1 Uncharacterised protein [Kingella potus]